MIQITIQVRTEEAVERLALHLIQERLLFFATMDTDHEELILHEGELQRQRQLLLQGLTKALLYRDVEAQAEALLGPDLVRIHATPVTHMDPHAQRTLLEQVVKV